MKWSHRRIEKLFVEKKMKPDRITDLELNQEMLQPPHSDPQILLTKRDRYLLLFALTCLRCTALLDKLDI